ncbi:MAG: aminotransferase class I/II-fold pyridoxal phosphate-dependent enzyme, partial [Clostridiaceae bacterium]|nr:aminotransferase class I/II-fold pyridoxal phosphate-dependent enzyme [Clostridiaceae bacterium]
MKYNFDKIVDRTNTNSIKYDFAEKFGMPSDILPLWVADMDFQAPAEVLEVLHQTINHGIFGYSEHKQDYVDVLHKWFSSRFGWDFEDRWLIKTPGIVNAIATAVRALTKPGEAIIIQQPVYYPFASVVKANDRRLVVNSLYRLSDRNGIETINNGEAIQDSTDTISANDYAIDFEDFEQKIISEDVKMFIFCSPHNPVGRVWSENELIKLGEICKRHKVLIVSDEIHADFIYPGYKHTIFSSLSTDLADMTILCTAPSKTFNLAGLQAANIFIS